MTTYTLHVPAGSLPGEIHALEEARLVRDGFSWGAFVFSFLWFFRHGLWLAGLAVLAAVVLLQVAVTQLPVGGAAGFWAQLLLSLLVGLEASSLQRWTYERRGRPGVAVVTARDAAEAEEKGFATWLAEAAHPVRRPLAGEPLRASGSAGSPALGLFPEEGGRR